MYLQNIFPPDPMTKFSKLFLPYESYTGFILEGIYRIKHFIRSEPHYDVFSAESLDNSNEEYEIRAYTLRGLSPKLRNYRVKKFKTCCEKGKSLLETKIEERGRNWLVFGSLTETFQTADSIEVISNWRSKHDYEAAFPSLPSHPAKESDALHGHKEQKATSSRKVEKARNRQRLNRRTKRLAKASIAAFTNQVKCTGETSEVTIAVSGHIIESVSLGVSPGSPPAWLIVRRLP